jgi:pyoverdine/dityrosine biosynthesis protein Dit1
MIDANTAIIGTGLSTMTKEMKAEGKATTLADAVGVGDQVAVTYTDGTHKMASEVRVTSKKK